MVCRGCKKKRRKFILLTKNRWDFPCSCQGRKRCHGAVFKSRIQFFTHFFNRRKDIKNKLRLGLYYTKFKNFCCTKPEMCACSAFLYQYDAIFFSPRCPPPATAQFAGGWLRHCQVKHRLLHNKSVSYTSLVASLHYRQFRAFMLFSWSIGIAIVY